MSAPRSHISVSLDGFAAGPNQSPERGKAAFDGAIEHDASPGLPDIRPTRLVEEADRGDEICRLVTYQLDRQPGDATRRAFEA